MKQKRWEESEKRKSEKKEDQRRAGAEPCDRMKDQKLHAVVARSRFGSEMLKTLQLRATFGS